MQSPLQRHMAFCLKNYGAGEDASGSNYFVRSAAYGVELLTDAKTHYSVLIHTSKGGNQQCLNSAYKILLVVDLN